VRHDGFIRGLVVQTVASITFMEPGEDFVRLVDYYQVERRTGDERFGTAFATGELPTDHVHPWSDEVRLTFVRLNAEQIEELVLPLANQRLGNDEKDALCSFRPALRDDQAGLDRLAETDFVREDAAALPQTPQREDHGVDLVRVRIDPCLTLGCCVSLSVVGSADPHKLLGEHPEIELVEGHRLSPPRGRRRHGAYSHRVPIWDTRRFQDTHDKISSNAPSRPAASTSAHAGCSSVRPLGVCGRQPVGRLPDQHLPLAFSHVGYSITSIPTCASIPRVHDAHASDLLRNASNVVPSDEVAI
jgi:hypothetical protein